MRFLTGLHYSSRYHPNPNKSRAGRSIERGPQSFHDVCDQLVAVSRFELVEIVEYHEHGRVDLRPGGQVIVVRGLLMPGKSLP